MLVERWNKARFTAVIFTAAIFSMGCGAKRVESTASAKHENDRHSAPGGSEQDKRAKENPTASEQTMTKATTREIPPSTPATIDHSRSHIGEYPGEQMAPIETPYPAPPVSPPQANQRGCVEGHQTYASRLEAERQKLRDAALYSLDAEWVEREGFFIEEDVNKMLDKSYQVDGSNFAVVGFGVRRSRDASVRIAKRGNTLHRVIDSGQYVPVTVQACGANPCRRGSGIRVVDEPIAIRLTPNEKLGPPIVLHYRYWEATLVYEVQRRCPPPPPSAKGA